MWAIVKVKRSFTLCKIWKLWIFDVNSSVYDGGICREWKERKR